MHESRTHLPYLVDTAADGGSYTVERTGSPVVEVTAVDVPESGSVRRVGFLTGRIRVPEDLDRMGAEEIRSMFTGGE